jgi:lipopolysaccharide transport system permease protein
MLRTGATSSGIIKIHDPSGQRPRIGKLGRSVANASTTIAEPTRAQEVLIRPAGRWAPLRLLEIWEYRELLYFLTKRQIQVRYKQSFFGVAWAVLQPLVLTFVFALFLGRLARVGSEGLPYPVFAITAFVPWLFFSQSVTESARSLVAESQLLSKVYFPRVMIPLSKILSLLIDLVIALGVVVVFLLLYGVQLDAAAPLLPLFLVLALVAAVGMGVFLAALNVRYRDVQVITPLLVLLWLFATPIVYPGSLVTGAWEYVYALNPLVAVIEGVRWTLVGTAPPDLAVVAISAAVAVMLLGVGALYFSRTERSFADII